VLDIMVAGDLPFAALSRVAGEIEQLGITGFGAIHYMLPPARLVELALARNEGVLSSDGALCVRTGKYTGRSPNDRYIVDTAGVHAEIDWGPVNIPMRPGVFDALRKKQSHHLRGRELFVVDAFLGADRSRRLPVRLITEKAWHALFCRQLFLRPGEDELPAHRPEFTVVATPELRLHPAEDGTRSEAAVAINFEKRMVLDIATAYAGEIKKSLFSVMNYILPARGVFPMHCSANVGAGGDTAIFFGLSGTGKTTLSADPDRRMIGDDEHGWSDDGIFNFEGGLYAKCINLSQASEPQIWNSLRFGAVMENVVVDSADRRPDFEDDSITENTRAGFPVEFIPGAVLPGIGKHPRTVIFLTADAFGVMPPVARLTREGAMYHFLSGFTSKLAGTERGIIEPAATFSTCFGAPFMPRPPTVYAKLLAERLDRHGSTVYLVDTGWLWGPYGVGRRIPIKMTRQIVSDVLEGTLESVRYRHDPLFNLDIPVECCKAPNNFLDPKDTWEDKAAYDLAARKLAFMFVENFRKFRDVPPEVVAAGPRP
jgi:phosphoenolpyruvate carboxykinase (ATP)